MIPTSIDGTDITGATIDGTDVTEITVDGQTVFTAGPTLQDIVAPGNLNAWYPFENGAADETRTGGILDNAGISVADSGDYSGVLRNGASISSTGGVIDLQAGQNSGVADISLGEYIDMGRPPVPTFPYSVTAWLFARGDVNIIVTFQGVDVMALMGPVGNHGNSYDFYNFNGGNYDVASSGISIQNQWVHLAGTMSSNGDMSIYADGVLEGTTTTNSRTVVSGREMGIGGADRGTPGTDALIDDVRWYDKELSASEVSQIYQNTEP